MARGDPFPRDIEEFGNDDRISFDSVEKKYLLVDDDQEEWEFSEATGKWFQPVSPQDLSVQR